MSRKSSPRKRKSAEIDPAVREAIVRLDEAEERRRIRMLLRLPMLKRTNFLRVRIGRGSALAAAIGCMLPWLCA